MTSQPTAAAAGTIDIGGDLTVNRMGYGAMRITGPGIWGDPPDRDQAKAALRRARGTGRQLHRHRRLLRPGGQRDPDRRGAVPLPRGPGHRDQGRPGAARPEPLGPRMAARSTCARRARAACGGCRLEQIPLYQFHRARPQGAAGRLHRRPGRDEGRGQDPAHRGVQLLGRAGPGGAADRPRGVGAEPLQRERPVLRAGPGPVQPGGPGVPAVGADPGDRPDRAGAQRREAARASASGRSRWPGCWPAPRRSCRSPAPGRPSTWRTTSRPPSLELTPEEFNSITDVITVGR